jgi:hypothetical protein
MRISFCESYCAPFKCLRSLFCCSLPSFVRTKDAPNLAPTPNSDSNQNSSANPIPVSESDAVSASVDEKSREEDKVGALRVEEVSRKSCLKKSDGEKKGNVKWMDLLGKELVEVKEYEPRYAVSLFYFLSFNKVYN